MEIKGITPLRRSDKKYTYTPTAACEKKIENKIWVSHTQMIHLSELLCFIAKQ
jgi:hypothetical protein